MAKFKVPVRVGVAPVQTYRKTVTVEADSREAAAEEVLRQLDGLISTPGWKAVAGPLGAIQPDRTVYETYLDEHALEDWIAGKDAH